MACSKCDYKGYKEVETAAQGNFYPSVKQCLDCDDISAYSKRVKELLDNRPSELPIQSRPKLRMVKDEDV
jgi:hypothetical protein